MSSFSIQAGATYLIPIPGTQKHLNLIVFGPFIPSGYSTPHIIIVNITTLKAPGAGDQTCVLNRGDHEFIDHKSIVNYPTTKCIPVSQFLIDFSSGRYTPKQPMKVEVLEAIFKGLMLSKHTPRKIKVMLTSNQNEATG